VTEQRTRRGLRRWTRAELALAAARGVAGFIGAYLLASTAASVFGSRIDQAVWLIDTRMLPAPTGAVLTLASAVLLTAFALRPQLSGWRRSATVAACAVLATAALSNAVGFYRAWAAGGIRPGAPVPLSIVAASVFALLAWSALSSRAPRQIGPAMHWAAVAAFVIAAVAFPLAQVASFGTSDYRAKADAAVVFGAMVQPSGLPSTSLADRVNTAVDLYRSGLVHTLMMSGAPEAGGLDEPRTMRAAAMRQGVPASAIIMDDGGTNTDATVADTAALFERDNIRSVLAVSQGYHLARVKLAYLAAGLDVRTVPAGTSVPIVQTPLYIVREIPAFWEYWARSLVRA
jgi:vancomycin permeability regulator SanA